MEENNKDTKDLKKEDNQKPIPGSNPSKKGLNLSDETWVELSRTSKSLEEMEKKIAKLNNVASQGAGKQKGFLSQAQVRMVMEMLDEIEDAYEEHYSNLERLQEEYNSKVQKMHEEILKSQELLTYAEGGADGSGDRLPEHEIERRRERRDTLIEEMERFKQDSQPDLEAIKGSIERLEQNKQLSHTIYNEDIGKLHEQNNLQGYMNSAAYSAIQASGMITSISSLIGFVSNGYNNLTQQQWGASDLGQKLEFYEGDDRGLRKDLTKVGRETGYDTNSTIQTGMTLSRGGVSDKEGFEQDIKTAQQVGRAFSIDPNQMADMGALMKQLNALEDGQMQRLANLIGNSVNKNGMKGREEEQLRSTQKLIESVTSNLNEVDFSQVQGLVGLQDLLAQSSAKLKGEGGAQLLQNIDSSIKNGGSINDILLGYGTDPRYQGIAGRAQLEYDKEKGISDPENLKRILSNAEKWSGTPEYAALMLKDQYNISLHDQQALHNSGAWQKIVNGEVLNEDILNQMDELGNKELTDSLKKYNESFTSTTRQNKVDKQNLGTYMAQPIQGVWEGAKDIFYSQPQFLQGLETTALGLTGATVVGKGIPKAVNKLAKYAPDIIKKYGSRGGGGTGGSTGIIDDLVTGANNIVDDVIKGSTNLVSKTKGLVKDVPSKASKVLNYVDEGASALDDILSNGTKAVSSSLDDVGKGALSGAGKAVGKLGSKAIPLIGAGIEAGVNVAQGDSVGKAVTKAGLSTALALGAGALLAPVTGGLSLGAGLALTGAVGIGSSVVSDKVVDSFWKDDKKDTTKLEDSPIEKTRKVESNVDKYKEMAETLDEDISSVEGNYNINISLSGNITGMDASNQTEVTNSVTDFFKDLLGGGRRSSTIDLSSGWRRG